MCIRDRSSPGATRFSPILAGQLQRSEPSLQLVGFLDLALKLYKPRASVEYLIDHHGVPALYTTGEHVFREVLELLFEVPYLRARLLLTAARLPPKATLGILWVPCAQQRPFDPLEGNVQGLPSRLVAEHVPLK